MPLQPPPPPARRFLSEGAPPAFHAENLRGVTHGFFGREGGVSSGVYASLNAGPGSKDASGDVMENRRRIAVALGVSTERLVGVHQVHSARALAVDAPWSGARPEADALVTATPGLALSILTADCTPVLLADVEAGVIGAAHAGWKGALGGVLEATIARMTELGAAPSRIAAAIGPTIAPESYEVGPEFEQRFRDAGHGRFLRAGAGDRFHFDLPGFCAARLGALGLGSVEIVGVDTYANDGALFSHRRAVHRGEADYGRNCAAILLHA